jgi:hypothetical protein
MTNTLECEWGAAARRGWGGGAVGREDRCPHQGRVADIAIVVSWEWTAGPDGGSGYRYWSRSGGLQVGHHGFEPSRGSHYTNLISILACI